MAGKANIVIRNTFIDAVPEDEEDDGPLDRTQSDTTGLRGKQMLKLGRLPSRTHQIQAIPEQVSTNELGAGQEHEEEANEEEEEDEDDDTPLARSKSVAYPAYAADDILTPASSSGGMPDAGEMLRLLQASGAAGSAMAAAGSGGYPAFIPGMPWPYAPYGMLDYSAMWPFPAGGGVGAVAEGAAAGSSAAAGGSSGGASAAAAETDAAAAAAKAQEAAIAAWQAAMFPPPPPLGQGPPIGMLHSFHQETRDMGVVTPDFRQFTKVGYEGRLSVVSEREVHTDGKHRYLVQFTAGGLSRADGVGFVFSPRLPCAKNIQRIVSIFVNQRGRICMRVFADIIRASAYVKALELGDWVEMSIDMDERVAVFNIWPNSPSGWPESTGQPTSTAIFPYGQRLGRLNQDGKKSGSQSQVNPKSMKLNAGHLACVVKNIGVTITVAS